MPKRKLRLIPLHDPASIFDDLEALRKATAASPATKRGEAPAFRAQKLARIAGTFAPIPHERAYKELRGINSTWMLLIVLHHLVLRGRGRNPVKLTAKALQKIGLTKSRLIEIGLTEMAIRWGLDQLERADVIAVERKRGRCPLVLHRWYPRTIGW
jgi:hypothetical protein